MQRLKQALRRLRDFWHAGPLPDSDRFIREMVLQFDRLVALHQFERLGPDRILEFDYLGQRFEFFLPHAVVDVMQREMLLTETFRDEVILNFIRTHCMSPGAHAIDVGANIGNHTVYFSKVCGASSVIAFEPSPHIIGVTRRNVEINDLKGVDVRNAAIGANSCLGLIEHVPTNSGGDSVQIDPAGDISVTALDAIGAKRCDFLKVDVEGMACDVIRGGRDMLATLKPPLLIELHRYEYEEGVSLLSALGYKLTKSFTERGATIDFLFEF